MGVEVGHAEMPGRFRSQLADERRAPGATYSLWYRTAPPTIV